MSRRELKALNTGLIFFDETSLRSGTVRMQRSNESKTVEDELRAQLEALCETLGQKDHELEMLKSEAESVKAELENTKGTAAT